MRLDIHIAKVRNISRQKAQELIRKGEVLVNGEETKPSYLIEKNDQIEIKEVRQFVSRAGEKLWGFIDFINQARDGQNKKLEIEGKRILDVGSSTGGFAEVLLSFGAKSIDCVDVGSKQLHPSLRDLDRIRVFENCDIRDFAMKIDQSYDLLTCDVSFISIKHIFNVLKNCADEMILLFKPQFELDRSIKRTKRGVVKDSEALFFALESFQTFLVAQGFEILLHQRACISGKEGNWEYFFWIRKCKLLYKDFMDLEICSLALGKFDGMHIAHFELFNNLKLPGAVLVISKDGNDILSSGNDRKFLMKQNFKDIKLFNLNLDFIREMSGLEFVAFLRECYPKLRDIVVGYDFLFGINRSCDKKDLQRFCAEFGIAVRVINEVKYRGISVHSGVIKEALKRGYLHITQRLLGRNYSIRGWRISGQGIGSKEIFATINLDCQPYFLPKNGVYAVRLNGLLGAGFIGIRSTDKNFSIEIHLLHMPDSWEMLNKEMQLEFLAYLRENKVFENINALKKQIDMDIKWIKKKYISFLPDYKQ